MGCILALTGAAKARCIALTPTYELSQKRESS